MCYKSIDAQYQLWLKQAKEDPDLIHELESIQGNFKEIEDRFYRNLEFGTGGLRGVLGAGTNRMNIYTVAKASQGLSDYLLEHFPEERRTIAVSYDSRIKSDLFARTAAGVFAANGIKVHIYRQLMPTPCLSFAVRHLHCAAGIMVTASHNPSKYNGYKVYGPDGCQITTETASEILGKIDLVDPFRVKEVDFQQGLSDGCIAYIPDEVETAFVEKVKNESLLTPGTHISRDMEIVYTPLNGTGLKPVLRTLRESGFSHITVVKEQEQPDGNFPTCPYPNPEIKEAMELGIAYAGSCNADLLLATDPDCDRVGIAVRKANGEFVLLSGNETGILLLDYICARRIENHTMPENPVMIKTIVTTDMAERIADHYGVRTMNVLTGFKFIGEQIGILEKAGQEHSYIFGFEESYGYLSGSYVRDKDAVNGVFLICEMSAYYKSMGIRLFEKLEELYRTYGYTHNTLHSYTFEGESGAHQMMDIMHKFHSGVTGFSGYPVTECIDYSKGIGDFPKAEVLKYHLAGGHSVVIRPSGTEPKMKVYLSVVENSRLQAEKTEAELKTAIEQILNTTVSIPEPQH